MVTSWIGRVVAAAAQRPFVVLLLSLGWELLVTLLFRPALLAVPPREAPR